MSIHRPLVPCTLNPIEYGLGRFVSCVNRIVSSLAHLIIVVTTSPSLKFTRALGWLTPPFFTTWSCSPLALLEYETSCVNLLPRLISIIIANGPMPWVGYKSPFLFTECCVRHCAS